MIVAVGSWRGVGATTTALLLAATLAERDDGAWLIEADPAGGVLAGRMRTAAHAVGGLERVAFASGGAATLELFDSAAQVAGTLRVVAAPADPFRAFACHHPRVPWVSALRDLRGSVVIDVGRVRAGTPVWPLLHHADAVLLVASPEVSAAVSAADWIESGGRISPVDPGLVGADLRLAIVDAPGGVRFSRSTLARSMADRLAGWLPWEPWAVDLLHRGATPTDRRLRNSPVMNEASRMVAVLGAEEERDR